MKDIHLPINVNCTDPKRVLNPYTNQLLTVPCGKCRACHLHKNTRLAFQCDLESYSNKYTVFITLTYANRFIPRAQFKPSNTVPFGHDVFDKQTGEYYGEADYNEAGVDLLKDKFHLFGDIPFLRKSDLQLFFKRFRYYAKKYTKDKIRYFGVGEYGPVHFRPHFHILLYFNDSSFLQVCEELVSKAWTYGRIDCQLSKGKCSSYVTSYVTSTCDLPRLFTLPAFKPFCVHSQRLGQGFFTCERERVYEMSPRDFIRKSVTINGVAIEFRLWRSCYAYFYPRCKGFDIKPTSERLYSYSVYRESKELVNYGNSIYDIASDIYAHLVASDPSFEYGVHFDNPRLRKLIEYFRESEFDYGTTSSDSIGHHISRIYTQLLVSKHFLTYVCDTNSNEFPTHEEIIKKVSLIENFYKDLEYLRLTEFFESQKLYYEDDLQGDEEHLLEYRGERFIPYFYDNCPIAGYKHLKQYHAYVQEVWKQSHDRVKHKIANDKNGIFLRI